MHDHDAFRPPSPKYDEKAYGFFTPAPLLPRAHHSAPQHTQHAADPRKRQSHTATKTPAEQQVDMHAPHAFGVLRVRTGSHAGYTPTTTQAAPTPQARTEAQHTRPQEWQGQGDAAINRTGTGVGREGDTGSDSDSDIPSPKYDETTCFFTRRRSHRHSKSTKQSLPPSNHNHARRPSGDGQGRGHVVSTGAPGTSRTPPEAAAKHQAGGVHAQAQGKSESNMPAAEKSPTTPDKRYRGMDTVQAGGVAPALVGSPAVQGLLQGAATCSHLPHALAASIAAPSHMPRALASTDAPLHAATCRDPPITNADAGSTGINVPMHVTAALSHMPALALLTPTRAAFTNIQPQTTASRLSVPTSPTGGPVGGDLKPRFRTAVPGKGHELTTISIEVLAATRGKLLPDPRYDRVLAVVVAVWYDHEDVQVLSPHCSVCFYRFSLTMQIC